MGIVITLLLLLGPRAVFAQEPTPYVPVYELQSQMDALGRLNSANPNCSECARPQPACSTFTDDMCGALWDKDHKGDLSVQRGRVVKGSFPGTDTSRLLVANYQALADSADRLPADLKKSWGKDLKRLQSLLRQKPYNDAWRRNLAVLNFQMDTKLQDAALARVGKTYPDIANKSESDRTFKEQKAVAEAEADLRNAVLDAKYKGSGQWQRVQRVFEEVRRDLEAEADNLGLSPQDKAFFLERLRTVRLTLPYPDSRVTPVRQSCGNNEENAMYFPNRHIFTVCMGLLNSLQNDDGLYRVIAHEMSHSVGPSVQASRKTQQNSKVESMMQRLAQNKDSVGCDEWNAELGKPEEEDPIPEYKSPTLANLYSCLGQHDLLDPWNGDLASRAAAGQAANWRARNAQSHSFLRLVQPYIEENGQRRPNEYFLRPDRLALRENGFLQTQNAESFSPGLYVATMQILKCDPAFATAYKDLKGGRRTLSKDEFSSLIIKTEEVARRDLRATLQYGGRSQDSLTNYNLSRSPEEDAADWLSLRALKRHIERIGDVNERRQAAVLSGLFFCDQPNFVSSAGELGDVEADFGGEGHSGNNMRQLAAFTPDISNLLQCQMGDDASRLNTCHP